MRNWHYHFYPEKPNVQLKIKGTLGAIKKNNGPWRQITVWATVHALVLKHPGLLIFSAIPALKKITVTFSTAIESSSKSWTKLALSTGLDMAFLGIGTWNVKGQFLTFLSYFQYTMMKWEHESSSNRLHVERRERNTKSSAGNDQTPSPVSAVWVFLSLGGTLQSIILGGSDVTLLYVILCPLWFLTTHKVSLKE